MIGCKYRRQFHCGVMLMVLYANIMVLVGVAVGLSPLYPSTIIHPSTQTKQTDVINNQH